MIRRFCRWAAVPLLLAGLAAGLDRAFPPDMSRLDGVGTEVVDRAGRTVALLPAAGGVWRFRVAADEVAPVLLETLVATEDRRFWWHPGFDPLALLRALIQDVRAGRIVSGGSTLTMQAARLLEPRARTWRAKAIEIFRAVQLEARFSKREILGIWLTLAPYGGNLEGVRAGSLAWFGVGPRNLDAAQAALLVAIPRRPGGLRPDRHAEKARALRDRILRADGGDVPERRVALPRHAALAVSALPRGGRVATTLDLPLQIAVERLAREQLAGLAPGAVVAMLVADGEGAIRAVTTAGRVALDLTAAVRSPGSALKPFVYAMAFQDGVLSPETRMEDVPRRFGHYAPENFDRGFAGSVTAGEALRRSLNLPAVAVLEKVGPLRFAATLRAAGVKLRMAPGAEASLPLALGGAGLTLREAAGLYAALMGDGTVPRLHLGVAAAGRLGFLGARAAGMTADVLTQRFPDGGRQGVAWKTGTSWGGRDAWALGFDRQHVVAVWVGRPDGTALPGATGRSMALPALGRVFVLLPEAPRAGGAEIARVSGARGGDGLRLLLPPPGAVLSGEGAVILRAMGGRRPLVFMVDGSPIAADPARREAAWRPAAPGFYRVTILDAEGAAAHAAVRVR